MLKYLIAVTQSLTVAALLCGLLYSLADRHYGRFGRRSLGIGMMVGAVAAAVMSWMKNKTSLVHTGVWNMRIFITATVALIVFLVFLLPVLRKKIPTVSKWMICLMAGLMAALLLFYALPDVYAYPFIFRKYNSTSVFSTDFLYRFAGYLLGLILMVLCFFAAKVTASKSNDKTAVIITIAALTVNAVQQVSRTLSTMVTRRIIRSTPSLFQYLKFTTNHSNIFIYGNLALLALLAVILWLRSFHVVEPYQNKAQHRKIRAKWVVNRRWATTLLACCLAVVLTLTVLYSIENRPVTIAEAEDYILENGTIYIPLSQVEDGKLHRFAFVTEKGIETRFIVIKKPNSSAYGIGLDACDICGDTGYYQRGDQVVCKLCDVVMNVNTIGFKGGCNPIPFDYTVSGGNIVIETATLTALESKFR